MGNESSQADRTGEIYQRDGKLIGPAMSPTPSIHAGSETERIIGPSMSPLPSDGETNQQIPASAKSTRKKKKRQKKDVDAVTSPEAGAAETAAMPDDEGDVVPDTTRKTRKKTKTRKAGSELEGDVVTINGTQPEAPKRAVNETPQSKNKPTKRSKLAAAHDDGMLEQSSLQEQEVTQSPQSSKRKRPRNKKRSDPQSPEAPHISLHAMGSSPPSAQQPTVNGILKYESDSAADPEDEIIPSSIPNDRPRGGTGSQPSDLAATDFELLADDEDVEEELSQDHVSQEDPQWLHKREINFGSDEEPIMDTRTSQEREEDAALPDLQPSQVKSEPAHSDFEAEAESEEESPSVARLERLERSRSRSMSRASASRLADEDLGLAVEFSRPRIATSPSSTGSNASIPARMDDHETGPDSRDSTRSESTRSTPNDAQPNGDAMDIDQVADQSVLKGSPAKRQAKRASMARKTTADPKIHQLETDENGEEPEHNGGADDAIPTEVEEATQQDVPQTALEEVSMQETATQPKKAKKKRRLQPKTSVSLSQLEGNDTDGEGESQSRLPSFSQNSKLKDDMRGGTNEPVESEAGEELPSTGRNSAIPQTQPQALPKPKRAKRKRRNDASEDELESRLSGRKMERSERLVMRRVLVAGVGCCSGGREERSRLRDTREERLD